MNTRTIGDAIATRFNGITATLPDGSSEGIAIGPTTKLPNAIAKGPALLVYPPSGVLDVGESAIRNDAFDFPVRLLRDPLDVPRRSEWLYAWIDAMRDRVEMQMSLGLAYVAMAQPIALTAEIDGFSFNGMPFDLVELIVRVQLFEHVTTVGI